MVKPAPTMLWDFTSTSLGDRRELFGQFPTRRIAVPFGRSSAARRHAENHPHSACGSQEVYRQRRWLISDTGVRGLIVGLPA